MFDPKKENFETPDKKYCANLIIHDWNLHCPDNRTLVMDAIKDYGYGGVVTNPNQKNGFFADKENVEDFVDMVSELEERDLVYWLYDEQGYPSGKADGLAVKGHPEFEAKGMYMVRRVAYEPRHTTFRIDDETDKIVWAAKYPLDVTSINDSFVIYDKMIAVEFTDDFCECDLEANEAFFVFCVKPAYEGSACTHNVSSFDRYINIMNPDAVRHFIDIAYEPIAKVMPDAYSKAVAVFTDEPSLVVRYKRDYETWPYALAPWTEGLFEEFEAEYGHSLLPYLPMIFEGRTESYSTRAKFYRLVGKLIAKAYSGQISEWCKAHGGVFSGHYMTEETAFLHVCYYGSFVEVFKKAGYPGIDCINCIPEMFNCCVTKYPHMVVRKNETNGMMLEISPFYNKEMFAKAPFDNAIGVINLLYAGGVRTTNSYFRPDLSYYDKRINSLGYMNPDEARQFNKYVSRLGFMLDEAVGKCNVFMYYGIEDIQSKMIPHHSAILNGPETDFDNSATSIAKKIYGAGIDYFAADRDDFVEAHKSLENGKPMISGNEVKVVIVPAMDVIYDETVEALEALKQSGVKVIFADKLPSTGATSDTDISKKTAESFAAVGEDEILSLLLGESEDFIAKSDDAKIVKARFEKEGSEMHFVINNTREKYADITFNHSQKKHAKIYNPEDGSVTPLTMGESYRVAPFRGVFVVFD